MRSSILIALKKIRKKKLQSFLIGLIIASSALLFSTAVGVMISINGPIDKMFNDTKSAHDIYSFSTRSYDAEKIESWWRSQKGVEKVQLYNEIILNNGIKLNNNSINSEWNYVSEVPDDKADIDNYKIVQGKKAKSPEAEEVWVNTGFADANNVKIGDTLTIKDREYKVSAIIVDTQFSSIMLGMERFWVRKGELNYYQEYKAQPMKGLAIRYNNPSSSNELWHSFENYLKGPFVGSEVKYDTIYQCYSSVLKYTGVFMLFFSVIIIFTAIFIVRFVISNSIYRDYKNIGIYKTLGFSSGAINFIYVFQYFIISLVSVVLGIILSKFIIEKLISSSLKIIGMESVNVSYFIPFVSTFITMMLLIAVSAYLSSFKANKIRPVEAIRNDSCESQHKINTNTSAKLLMKFSFVKAIGLKSLMSNKKSALLIFVSIFITLYASIASVNLVNTTDSINRNFGYWGFDNSMVDLKSNSFDDKFVENTEKDLKNNPYVKNYSTSYYYSDASFVNKKGDIEKLTVSQVVGDNSDQLGFMEMEGRNPEKVNEVSVSINTARSNNKNVGDYLDVYIKDKKYNLMIVGIYQSLNGLGKGIRLYDKTVKDGDPAFMPDILVNLKSRDNIDSFIKSMRKQYGERVKVTNREDEFKDELKLMTQDSKIAVVMIICIMISICFLNIFNITLMNINEEKKKYGIYKAIGMTSGQIRNSILFKISVIFTAALILAVPITLELTPVLMSLIFVNMGIAKYPVINSVPHMIIIIAICFGFVMISAYASSKMIEKIKLRSLIEE